MDLVQIDAAQFEAFTLVLFRVAGIVFIAPILGARNLPFLTKTGLTLLLALLILPNIDARTIAPSKGPFDLAVHLTGEALVGIAVGLVVDFFFSGIELAGEWLGVQIGFGVANVLDPQGEHQVTILAQIKILIAFMLFLIVDGHHALLRSISASFDIVPLHTVRLSGRMVEFLFASASQIFVLGIKIAAPVMGVLFLVEVAMALVARTVPQMNVLMVGLPIKLLLGIIALGTIVPVTSFMILKNLPHMQDQVGIVMKLMRG